MEETKPKTEEQPKPSKKAQPEYVVKHGSVTIGASKRTDGTTALDIRNTGDTIKHSELSDVDRAQLFLNGYIKEKE